MNKKTVAKIILPYVESLPINPSVNAEDKIINAIELMVKNNLRCVAVVRNHKPIGMIRLDDAFSALGLKMYS
ncbi:MAG: CBS domain-containing protein [Desulfobacterales bacterium]|nr:CBS domain-containing protein [Desulfobacterales bacterium]MBF0397373.1 CBS domain-containing protein [Desulfobacterales bacterium]